MDAVIIWAAIIGAVGACIAAVITWALTRVSNKESRLPLLGARQRIALEGRWRGKIHQRQGPTRDHTVEDWIMKTEKHLITGTFSFKVEVEEKDEKGNQTRRDVEMSFEIVGALIHGRYFKMEYRGLYQGREEFIQFGVAILELSLDAHTLKGYFVGIGQIAERIIDGPVELWKSFT